MHSHAGTELKRILIGLQSDNLWAIWKDAQTKEYYKQNKIKKWAAISRVSIALPAAAVN